MERFHLYRPPGAGGAFMAAADDGPWVRRADAQAALDAANQRATYAERRLALAVAEVRASRVLLWSGGGYTIARPDGDGREDCQRYEDARLATNADPELAKMIERNQ